RLLRNDLAPDNNWVRLNLEDSAPVFGARVRLSAGGRQQLRYVQPSRSYLSQTEVTLTFGLGAAERIDALEITWPDGVVESPPPPPLNAAATIRRRR
ncbi:MAG: ASPIC/UnbV domain-containing protein, partial [Chromatiales bacterium]|nr:ASPIC/UnbV domain-containing protein [Chromatiales bacterium]